MTGTDLMGSLPSVFEITEDAPMRGSLTILLKNKDDEIIDSYIEDNLVVNNGKAAMASLLAGQGSGLNIVNIAFGEDISAPNLTDATILNPVSKPITGVTFPIVGQAKFAFELDQTEANGKFISSFGLLSANGTLICKKVRTPIEKTADFSMTGFWTVIF